MIPIRQIPMTERPREKLIQMGAQALSNTELLALLLGSGSTERSALELASHLLSLTHHGISQLRNFTLHQLMEVHGIGPGKASVLLAAFELSQRVHQQESRQANCIQSPAAAYQYVRTSLENLEQEIFVVLHLNTKNHVIEEEIVTIGTLNASLVHPREVFKNAIKNAASSILVLHNHPSGDATPSKEDIEITHRLSQSGEILGIPLVDHIIVGRGTFHSLKSEGHIL